MINLEKTWHKFVVFCGVGAIAFSVDWVVFNILYNFTKLFVVSIGFGWVASMIFNFITNRNITFNAKGHSISKQLTRWITVYGVAFLVRIIVGKITLSILSETVFNVNVAYLLGVAAMIPVSFFGSLFWAFNKK